MRKNTVKDKTGLFFFLKQAWSIAVERAKIHKSLRLLNKQNWSVEFLTALLFRASKAYGQHLEMTITGPGGLALTVRTTDTNTTSFKDESILDNLDDEVKLQQYIAALQKGKK